MGSTLLIVAGPCVVESRELLYTVADHLCRVCAGLPVRLVFKASYRKANRTSAHSFTGVGDEQALELLAEIRRFYDIPVLTDVHTPQEAGIAAQYVDVLQIPAFLCRQTELLMAAGATGKVVNVKKGQFMAPESMAHAVEKVRLGGGSEVWLTERGTMFGYRDLVVDFRSLVLMRQTGCPVLYDATHSVQQPNVGERSGGRREFVRTLARAALAVGVDGIFFETHPEPARALSDPDTQLPLQEV
ncbi:MAG: 3-deoxy-8-phosphooctulonate synthase, partial [Bacteroidota bacterium]|nr:3-deoxy-8-phosphooctulonate synthase [Bacteroidota bacterium]